MSYGSAHLWHAMFDALRTGLWTVASGFAVVGGAFYGGAAVANAWRKVGPPPRRRDDDEVRHEAAAGIAEIEVYLAAQHPELGPPQPPAPRRNLPPASGEAV